jgi:hypothetical protein
MNERFCDPVVSENAHEQIAESIHLLSACHGVPIASVGPPGHNALPFGLARKLSPVVLHG